MAPLPPKQYGDVFVGGRTADAEALNTVLPLIYDELRRLARHQLRQQRPNHTLQTTALVHEAYLRLAGGKSLVVENRMHFLGIAGQLMRWILVDYERKRRTRKRGSGFTNLSLDETLAGGSLNAPRVDLLALDSALYRLAKLDEQQSRIIELRYFAGLSIEDTAEFLGISPATVKRSWTSARAWLLREMNQEEVTQ
jgi:RNA polymerase sigma factor (TIGR02999 family)